MPDKLVLILISALIQVSVGREWVPQSMTAAEMWNPWTWYYPYSVAAAEAWREYLKNAQEASNQLYQQWQATGAKWGWWSGGQSQFVPGGGGMGGPGGGNNPGQGGFGQGQGDPGQGPGMNGNNQGPTEQDWQKHDDTMDGQQSTEQNEEAIDIWEGPQHTEKYEEGTSEGPQYSGQNQEGTWEEPHYTEQNWQPRH